MNNVPESFGFATWADLMASEYFMVMILLFIGALALIAWLVVSVKKSSALPEPKEPDRKLAPAQATSEPELQPEPDQEAILVAEEEEEPKEEASFQPQEPEKAPAAAAPEPSVEQEEIAAPNMFQRLVGGLQKTRKGFISRIEALLSGDAKISQDKLDELEEILLTADIGVRTGQRLLDLLRQKAKADAPATALRQALMTEIQSILGSQVPQQELTGSPHVILVVGVNGTGKTTTIGKLAHHYKSAGYKVLLAAGDTYRAAAIDQLVAWGDRVGVEVVRQQEGSDPAAVIYDAIEKAKTKHYDLVIADTAGRLHTKKNLMEEMRKIYKTCNKVHEGAPHEVLLVLDSTTGQNAIVQAREFQEVAQVNAIALTKLDGTAKGGIVIGIVDELQIPVKFIGIGEAMDDLRPFIPEDFTKALFA